MVLIETRGRGTIVDGEVGVGLRPVGGNTVEDSLAMEFVKTLNGVLGVDSVAMGNKGAGELGHDLRPATIPKAILANSDLFLDPDEGLMELHDFQALFQEGSTIVDSPNGVSNTSGGIGGLGGLIVFVESGKRPTDKEVGDGGRDISRGDETD
jgi:hypothetical protein